MLASIRTKWLDRRRRSEGLLAHGDSGIEAAAANVDDTPVDGAVRSTLGSTVGRALGAPALGWDFAQALVVLLPAVLLAVMGFDRRWISDDGFIDLRIARHLIDGHGPLYNVDERVEAYTNPLWVVFLALWGRLGGTLETGAVFLGLLLSVMGVLAAQAAAVRVSARTDGAAHSAGLQVALPLGAVVYTAVPAAWDFATSGLETGLALGWLGLSYWLMVCCLVPKADVRARGKEHEARTRWWIGASAVIGLGSLVRPDLAVFSAAFLMVLLVGEASRVRRSRAGVLLGRFEVLLGLTGAIRLLVAAALIPMAYQVFRMGYFAGIVPNTAVAKEAGAANWVQGWRYAADFSTTYALAVPLTLLLAWWGVRFDRVWVRRDWVGVALLLAPVAGGTLHALFVIRVGADFMHARMLLPSLFGVLLPVATVTIRPFDLRGWRLSGLPTIAAGAIAIWAVACALSLRVPYPNGNGPDGIADERGYYAAWAGRPNPVRADDYKISNLYQDGLGLRQQAEAGGTSSRVLIIDLDGPPVDIEGYTGAAIPLSTEVSDEVNIVSSYQQAGVVGYVAGKRVHVVDRFGLADPIDSRFSLGPNRGRPGHEKWFSNVWILGRFATLVPGAAPEVRAAHEALRCGELQELRQAVDERLSVGRFLENVRNAWSFYHLRIPGDPLVARAQFCGAEATASPTTAINSPLQSAARSIAYRSAPPTSWIDLRRRRMERSNADSIGVGKIDPSVKPAVRSRCRRGLKTLPSFGRRQRR